MVNEGCFFVVGLQPTICMHIVTQGFVRLRLTTPCAKLRQAYSLRHGIACVVPSGLYCARSLSWGFIRCAHFTPGYFVSPWGFGRFAPFTPGYSVSPLRGSDGLGP